MNDFQFPIIFTIICLIPILFFSIFVAWRVRDLKSGLRFFLLLAGYFTLIFIGIWLFIDFTPENIQKIIFRLVFYASVLFIIILGLNYLRETLNSGSILVHSKRRIIKPLYLFIGMISLISLSGVFTFLEIRGSGIFLALMALDFAKELFFSFQIREQGIFARGKFYKTSEISSIEWNHKLNKQNITIIMKNTKSIKKINTPWELIIPIDNYIKNNFPTT